MGGRGIFKDICGAVRKKKGPEFQNRGPSGHISPHLQKKKTLRMSGFPLCHPTLIEFSCPQVSSLPGAFLLQPPHCLFFQPAVSLP